MMAKVWFVTVMLVVCSIVSDVATQEINDYDYENLLNEIPKILPYIASNQYNKKVDSIFDVYKGDRADRTVIETNALINTKYRTWKRNADLINSILALPKGMNDAGRR